MAWDWQILVFLLLSLNHFFILGTSLVMLKMLGLAYSLLILCTCTSFCLTQHLLVPFHNVWYIAEGEMHHGR